MSMNLTFFTKVGDYNISFPFQTKTSTSYAVMEAKAIEEKLEILRKDIEKCDDKEWIEEAMNKIERMLNDDTLRLEII